MKTKKNAVCAQNPLLSAWKHTVLLLQWHCIATSLALHCRPSPTALPPAADFSLTAVALLSHCGQNGIRRKWQKVFTIISQKKRLKH